MDQFIHGIGLHVRQQHQHPRRRHARGGLPSLAHARDHFLRPIEGHPQREGRRRSIGEDVREGLTAIISVKLRNPQFEGQTKTKLGNTEIRSFVETSMNQRFAEFMEEHPSEARAICTKAIAAQRARLEARKARDLVRRKSLLESTTLPGKLADCQTRDPNEAELYIVEGDSAGGTAKTGRAARVPSDPSATRQDPQRRASAPGEDPREQRDPGDHHRGRHRHRRGVRYRRSAAITRSSRWPMRTSMAATSRPCS